MHDSGTERVMMRSNVLTRSAFFPAFPRSVLAAGRRHTVALRADGTVLAAGDNKCGQCEVGAWRDIVAVAAGNVHVAANTGNAHTVGLRADGTVAAAGWNKHGQCEVDG